MVMSAAWEGRGGDRGGRRRVEGGEGGLYQEAAWLALYRYPSCDSLHESIDLRLRAGKPTASGAS